MRINSRIRVKRSFLLIIGAFLTFFFFVNVSANTAYTGMRNISGLQLTADMGTGWNLGNTLDAPCGETCWGNPTTTKAMIDKVKAQGFKTIRIPTTWGSHVGGSPNYTIDGNWLNRVETVCNYAFENDMYVILNTHHEGDWCKPTYAQESAVKDKLVKIWTQIANRFKNYGDYLIFETLNEPRLEGSAEEWTGGTAEGRDVVNRFNKAAVDAIRATGGNNSSRFIMCPPYAAAGGGAPADAFVIPNNDSRVIVSVHNYSPYSFALQTPGTSTFTSSDKSTLDSDMSFYYNKWISGGRAVVIGEWGTVHKNNTSERAAHATYFIQASKSRQLTAVLWDNGGGGEGGMGHLNRSGLSWYFPTIVNAITSQFSGSCTPTAITPYIQANGTWTQTSSVAVASGTTIQLGPQPTSGGSWSWSGMASGTSREVSITVTSSGTATATYTNSCGAQTTQNFNITVSGGGSNDIVNGGVYRITPRNGAKAVDVYNCGTANGTNVQNWSWLNNTCQQWQFTSLSGGYWRITPQNATSSALDVNGVSTADGANVQIWAYGGGNNQQWQVVNLNNGYYQIVARHSGKCLDLQNGSTADGSNFHQWTCSSSNTNQHFTFTRLKSAIADATEISAGKPQEGIHIFPNPSDGNFKIAGAKNARLRIYTMSGKLVYSRILNDDITDISPKLESGAYILKTEENGKVTSSKLFIK